MVRTRFAPSPTGYLHIGGLRTALYAYLFAKKNNGTFILRIEDTDLERKIDDANQIIYRTLKDAGLCYTEGPDVGGEFGPYVQSERKEIYQKYAKEVVAKGAAYYCFCTKERLEKMHADGAGKYDKTCASIPLDEAERRVASGEKYVIRQNIPISGTTHYTDMVFGDIVIENKELEDNVLIKSDGMPTYNFANVIDDHLMGINYVIRGTEYLSSTPKYNHLYDALGWERPNYIHLQPIMKDATRKLSKRHGDASYEDFIAKGYLKEAIINYIALLGWSPKDNREKLTLEEMQQLFSLEGLSKSASIFDENKMRWLNSLYIKELPVEEFHKKALPFYKKLDYLSGFDLNLLSTLLHSRCEVLSDIENLTEFLNKFEGFDLTAFENKKWKTDSTMAKAMLPKLIEMTKTSFDTLDTAIESFATDNDYKKGQVMWIFRIALTGSPVTPGGTTEMANLLGKEEAIKRLESVLKRVE